ncbi:MAG: hypothetical protein KJO64_01955, partial [Bacteroidia bacterium]|nr:hypothetical protein [Bacteroidia bacterium]
MGLYRFTALIFFSFVISFTAFGQTDTVCTSNTVDTFYINSVADADSFLWSVPPGAIITSGQYDTLIVVNWSGAVLGLDSVCVTALNECGPSGTTCVQTFVMAPPTPAIAGPNFASCNVTSVNMAGNTPTQGSGVWTKISGPPGETITTPSSATTSITGLIAGSYSFVWTITNSPCGISSDTMDVDIDALPTTANAGTNDTICSDSYTLNGNNPAVGTGIWTLISGAGTFTDSSVYNTGLSSIGFGINRFRWTISNGVCTPSTDDVIIVRDVPPSNSNAGPDQVICATSTTLQGNNPAEGTGQWSLYTGTGTITNNLLYNSTVTALGAGVNEFIWTTSQGTCPVSRDTVSITRDVPIASIDAGTDQNLCNITTTTLAGNTPAAGETGTWSTVSGFGSASAPNNPSSGVTGLSIGSSTTFRWTITTQYGVCPDSTEDVVINVDSTTTIANAGADQALCNATTTTLTGNAIKATESVVWAKTFGPGVVSSPNSTTTGITGLIPHSFSAFTYTISSENGACANSIDFIIVSNDSSTTPANAGSDQYLCNVDTTYLSGNSLKPTENGIWSIISGTALVDFPNSPTSSVRNLSIGDSATLQWKVNSFYGGCPSDSDVVTIYIDTIATPSIAGTDQYLCNTATATLSGNAPAVGETGTWSVIYGSATVTSINSNTSGVTGLSANDSSILVWTIDPQYGGCPSTTDTVVLYVDPNTTIANAGADQNICNLTTATLDGNAVGTGESGLWTLIGGVASITTPSSPTSGLTGLVVGDSAILVWTISSEFGGCSSTSDTVYINVDPNTTVANAGADQNLCNITTATLGGNAPAVGESGLWTVLSGTATFADSSIFNTGVSGLTIGGTAELIWTISSQYGGCLPTSDTVVINVDPTTTIANAGPDQNLCNQILTVLAANSAVGGETGYWTHISGPGSVSSPFSENSAVTGLTDNSSTILVWTIAPEFAGCDTTRDTVVINVDPNTTIANAGSDQNICNMTTATLGGNAPAGSESGLWTVISGTAIFADSSVNNTGVSGLTIGGSATLVWTISPQFGGCSATSDTVIINVDPATTVATAGADQNICNLTTATLGGNAPAGSESGLWTLISGTAIFADSSVYNTGVTGLTIGGSATLVWTISPQFGGCLPTSDTVVINVDPNTTIANAGADQNICNITTATLDGNAPAASEDGLWTLISGTAIFADSSVYNTGV